MAKIPLSGGVIVTQWIGVDGGGTKTQFTLFDEKLNALDSVCLPSCHAAQVGYDGMNKILSKGIAILLKKTTSEVGLGFGLAGYGQKILQSKLTLKK